MELEELKNFRMDNLRKIREDKNINQLKLSTDIEVSQELISQYELGKTLPTTPNLLALSKYFKCSVDYLLQKTDISTPVNLLVSTEYKYLLNGYDKLDTDKRKHLIAFLDFLNSDIN